MKITIVGLGYVGLSNAILLSSNNNVIALDVDKMKVDALNRNESPIEDSIAEGHLKQRPIEATTDKSMAYKGAEYVVVCTPTDYDPETNHFDTSLVRLVIDEVQEYNKDATVVIKSTIPVGFVESIKDKYDMEILFSPEFLREGTAVEDNLYPSRIIVGGRDKIKAEHFSELLKESSLGDAPVIITDTTEAEAIKLFSNSYLAMRVAYFNELDSYAEHYNLNTRDIIDGVGLDPRIGTHYNNPSFGYGGYCFPKDTKQLKANFVGVQSDLIGAIVDSNETRKNNITRKILQGNPSVVGVHRLIMKTGSDNFRSSAIQDIIAKLSSLGVNIIIYEPTISGTFNGIEVVEDLEEFKMRSNKIIANRLSPELSSCQEKVYTRDVYNEDK